MAEKAAGSQLTISVERSGDVVTVKCRGRLVAGVNEDFYADVRDRLTGCHRMVLDFAELTHMDSMGLGSLVRLYVSAKSAGCVLELTHVGKPIRHLLGITHMLSVFESIGENKIKMM